jgi:hypothetical protein
MTSALPSYLGNPSCYSDIHFKREGLGGGVLFAHLNRVQKPLRFLCSQYLCPDQSLGRGVEGKRVSSGSEIEEIFVLDHDGVI